MVKKWLKDLIHAQSYNFILEKTLPSQEPSQSLFHAWETYEKLFHTWETCRCFRNFSTIKKHFYVWRLFFASKCSRLKYVTVKHYPILQGSTENLTCPWAVGMILVTLHMYTHYQIFTTHLKFSWCALITYHIQ